MFSKLYHCRLRASAYSPWHSLTSLTPIVALLDLFSAVCLWELKVAPRLLRCEKRLGRTAGTEILEGLLQISIGRTKR